LDWGRILQDPQAEVLLVGNEHTDTESLEALIAAIPDLVRKYGITDLALEHPREFDALSPAELIQRYEQSGRWNTDRLMADLIATADWYGLRIWGLDLPEAQMPAQGEDPKLGERNQAFATAISEHRGPGVRILARVGLDHLAYDPSVLNAKPRDVPAAQAPTVNMQLAGQGVGSVAVAFYAPSQTDYLDEHAQVRALSVHNGDQSFMADLQGPWRQVDWIIAPGLPTALQASAVMDPVAAGDLPWMATPEPEAVPDPVAAGWLPWMGTKPPGRDGQSPNRIDGQLPNSTDELDPAVRETKLTPEPAGDVPADPSPATDAAPQAPPPAPSTPRAVPPVVVTATDAPRTPVEAQQNVPGGRRPSPAPATDPLTEPADPTVVAGDVPDSASPADASATPTGLAPGAPTAGDTSVAAAGEVGDRDTGGGSSGNGDSSSTWFADFGGTDLGTDLGLG